ncbi:MAG: virulence RhuM family protein [Muribaculaceae bacterium]|nr:virulence RhuM family protein [Muribaculaceae bacterium]
MEDNKIIIYQTDDGQTRIDVRMENETVWLSSSQMSLLFDREESNIRRHILNVFKERELNRENNVHFLHVNGVKKPVPFYNLDVIISVGYRVKSKRGTSFRIQRSASAGIGMYLWLPSLMPEDCRNCSIALTTAHLCA